MTEDSRLRAQFAALRRTEAASAPSYAHVMAGARRRSDRPWRRITAAACTVAIAAIALIVWVSHPRGSPPGRASAQQLAHWRAPTDFLLDTPDRPLLHTIPELGRDAPTIHDPWPPTGMTTPAPDAGLEHS